MRIKDVTVMVVACMAAVSGCVSPPPPEISDWVQPEAPDYEARVANAAKTQPVMNSVYNLLIGYVTNVGEGASCFFPDKLGRLMCHDVAEPMARPLWEEVRFDKDLRIAMPTIGLRSSPSNAVSVYQPKDKDRLFFSARGNNQAPYWVLYDPEGRDVGKYLTSNGFTNVRVVSSRVAIADPIQDRQKRREFWIWVQARERRMKEFEEKYPHLAATVAPKE